MIPLVLTVGVMCHGIIAYYRFMTEGGDFLGGWGFLLMLFGVIFFWVSMVIWSLT